jgi:hypothetical protein
MQCGVEGMTPPATQPDTPVPIGVGHAITLSSGGGSGCNSPGSVWRDAGPWQEVTPSCTAAPKPISPRTLRWIVGKVHRDGAHTSFVSLTLILLLRICYMC